MKLLHALANIAHEALHFPKEVCITTVSNISMKKKVHHYEQKINSRVTSGETWFLRSYWSDVGTMYFLLSLPDMQLL